MLVLYDDLKKASWENLQDAALRKLLTFLNTNEPGLVKFLQSFWGNQQRAITYKELRESIMRGYLDEEMLNDWRQDYSRFVVDYVEPMWLDAMQAANTPIKRNGLVLQFDSDTPAVKEWTDINAARFVTRSTEDQIKAIRAVVKLATQLNNLNVDTLSHVIRPMVGLNYRQSMANMNYYQTLIDSGVKEKKAVEMSIKYSARQNRYRGYMISRTELAFAYNQGSLMGTAQAINSGLLGHTVKKWCTADDERVCEICGQLEGQEFEMDEDITYMPKGKGSFQRINPRLQHKSVGKSPPAHPHCRCTVLYVEKSPPIYNGTDHQQVAVNIGPDGEIVIDTI